MLEWGEKARNVLFYSSSCSNGKNKELVNETEKAYGTLIAFMSASFSLNYNYKSFWILILGMLFELKYSCKDDAEAVMKGLA